MIVEKVSTFIASSGGVASDALLPDTPLLQNGLIDSLGMEDLVVFLEGTFGIQVDDDDLMPDHFETVAAIAAFVERKMADKDR